MVGEMGGLLSQSGCKDGYLMSKRFFILGCQRSGTTLLRLILESHPDIFCYDELKAYAVLQGRAQEEPRVAKRIGFKVPRWTEQFLSAVLWDDGLDETASAFYLSEPILFVLRNAYDNIASMRKLKAGDKTWCELWVPRILNAKIQRDEAFRLRFTNELSMIEAAATEQERLTKQGALYWKYKTAAIVRYRNAGFPVLPVSYERLVTQPEPTLRAICQHLVVQFDDRLLHHNEFAHTEVFAHGRTVGETDPNRPIQSDSVGQSVEWLSDQDKEWIDSVIGDLPLRISALFSAQ
jgi:hypothetical protein